MVHMARGRRTTTPPPPAARSAHPRHPAARVLPSVSMADLAARIARAPQGTLCLSDVHGRLELLADTLTRLGVLGADGRRRGPTRVVQLGDLVDGRHPDDAACAEAARAWCDVVVIGNHDAAHLGGPTFTGLAMVRPEVTQALRRLAREEVLQPAAAIDGVLVSHAGLGARWSDGHARAEDLVASLADDWWDFCARGRLSDRLFGVGPERGGCAVAGGICWQDFAALLDDPAPDVPQLVGHTPGADLEGDADGRVACIDLGGPRLGVAWLQDGTMTYARTDA